MKLAKPSRDEVIAATIKSGLGLIPIGGSALAEFAGMFLPNRQMERVEKMLALVGAQVAIESPELFEQKIKQTEFGDLFEQGVYDAAKAITDERIASIANILVTGSSEGRTLRTAKVCLSILHDLTDIELAMLLYVQRVRLIDKKELNFTDPWTLAHNWLGPSVDEDAVMDDDQDNRELGEYTKERLIQKGLLRQVANAEEDESEFDLTKLGHTVCNHIRPVNEV